MNFATKLEHVINISATFIIVSFVFACLRDKKQGCMLTFRAHRSNKKKPQFVIWRKVPQALHVVT